MKTNILAVDPLEQSSSRNLELLKILNENKFVDVTIVTESEEFQAHKVILSSVSPVLKRIFDRNNQQHPLLYMRATKSQHIKALIDFIYQGQAVVEVSTIREFISLGNELQIQGLFEEENNSVQHIKEEKSDNHEAPPDEYSKVFKKTKAKFKELNNTEGHLSITHVDNDASDTEEQRKSLNKMSPQQGLTDEEKSAIIKRKSLESIARKKLLSTKYFKKYDAECEKLVVRNGQAEFACTECPKITTSASHAKEHAEVHMEVNRFQWRCICGEVFNRKYQARTHYPCRTAIQKFITKAKAGQQQSSETVNSQENTQHFETISVIDYEIHIDKYLGKIIETGVTEPWICNNEECKVASKNRDVLMLHIESVHLAEFHFTCDGCPEKFERYAVYQRHKKVKNCKYVTK